MKQQTILVTTAILLAAFACSCSPAVPVPNGYVAPFENVQYEKIPDINPGSAKEVKISLPQEMTMPKVISLPGGGALALGQKVTYGEKNEVMASKIMAARYDATGKTVWTKVIAGLDDGTVQEAVPLPGGGFAFTYAVHVPYTSGGSVAPNAQRLVFCGPDGNVLQKVESNQGNIFQKLRVTDDGEVFAVGMGYFKDGKPVEDPAQITGDTDISIMKFSESGKLLYAKNYAGKGHDNPTVAMWSREAGLALAVCIFTSPDTQVSLLMLFDDEGNRKWQYFHEGQNRLCYDGMLPVGGGFLAEGFDNGRELIMKLSIDGKMLWETVQDESKSAVIAMAAMPGGGFATAVNCYDDADPNLGVYLALFDQDGKQTKKTILPNGITCKIITTSDGGLLTVSLQNVKCLPQPAYINSIWFDTETVVTKYDKDLKIQWRKVYDKYKDSTKSDIAVPQENGTVIVEK